MSSLQIIVEVVLYKNQQLYFHCYIINTNLKYVYLATDPVRFLIAICIFSNIGGAATMVGDPPNLLIAADET